MAPLPVNDHPISTLLNIIKTQSTSVSPTPTTSSTTTPTASPSPSNHNINNLLPLAPTTDGPVAVLPIPHPTDYILYFLLGCILGILCFLFTYHCINKYHALPALRLCPRTAASGYWWRERGDLVMREGARRRQNSGARGGAGVLRPLEGGGRSRGFSLAAWFWGWEDMRRRIRRV
ncbi:hypothetical protein GLAREA_02704 [Glarea lozoyensis ATCC 20868]|uniref:Uncharacterized protein n=1 Tax=Glarea lozoyensis (strain ATCC 20868 / MF5171) TaxID=1116229 RepID=S3CM87_GLAL2|nr:uncharacterized protein GLAREA_02704 [Glarea lozoyensis ATCC 20868]EPE26790.1 hypothetical protein GLAREA_02704 [Glarea lozoyensis ATCC 20868]